MHITTQTLAKNREGQDELFVSGSYLEVNTGIERHFAKWLDAGEYSAYLANPDRLPEIMDTAIARMDRPKTSVSMRQARLALLQSGKLAAVNAALAALPGEAGETARIEWEYATEVDPDWPLVHQLASALTLTDDDLNALFALARTL